MNFPIELSFKILALASQIYIRDANRKSDRLCQTENV